MIKCVECEYKELLELNGSPNRYYCNYEDVTESAGSRMICRCKRDSNKMNIKTSPKWCPLRENKLT